MEQMKEEIGNLPFFQGFPEKLNLRLFKEGHLIKAEKGSLIFRSGDHLAFAYLLLAGEVMLYNLTRHGNRKIIFLLGPGHLVNHNLMGSRKTSVFCEAVSDARLLAVPLDQFIRIMESTPLLMRAVMTEYERYIWRLDHQLKNTAGSMLVERKTAAKLWKLGRDFGIPCKEGIFIRPELTMTLLADMVGVPRETVSRACKSLARQQLILWRKRHFILPDPDALADFYKGSENSRFAFDR